jgi:pyruvate/2-oxoglutarate dehydrogenase complex dihydrolipoamide acyltransferase (E2) component
MATNVIMPQLGESVVEGTVSRWLKRVGDPVNEYDPLVEVSTDKVDTEIPAPATGILLQILVEAGSTVERGTPLAVIGQLDESPTPVHAAVHAVAQPTNGHSNEHSIGHSADTAQEPRRYSPVVMRMAAEHRLDLERIKGTGMGGRVTKKDVEAFLSTANQPTAQPATQTLAPWETPGSGDLFKPTDEIFKAASAHVQTSAPSTSNVSANRTSPPQHAAQSSALPGELTPLSTMRRVIAEHMVRSKLHTAPHVTTVFEVDVSCVMRHWRANMDEYAKNGVKLTLTAYFVAAIVRAARAYPILNSRWSDDGIYTYHTVNVGMAVAMQDGLIVPVIKNAQDLSLSGLARAVSDLATRARGKSLRADETQGGTITLTNHGVSGSLLATPIINQPQSAIVGVGAVKKRVVVQENSDGTDAMVIRPMMYATLTFDHRVTDGAAGDGFLAEFTKTLETWE